MPNPKTLPARPKPKIHDGWIRKSDLDAWLDRYLPIPTQVISNEEYQPIPQTAQQCRLEQQILANAELKAKYLGVDRRKFLRSSCGMALAFATMNTIFGPFFRVEAAELLEPGRPAENKGHTFIFDVQTHHVAMPSQNPHADPDFPDAVVGMRDMASKMNPVLRGRKGKNRGCVSGELQTWAAFVGTNDNAAIAGDIAMLESEVTPTLKALRSNGLDVVAIHHHMINSIPMIIFLHYWGRGPADKLATGFKAAVDGLGESTKQ